MDEQSLSDAPVQEVARYSFIVRLWKEEPSSEERPAQWRGQVTAIPGGERHYFRSVDEIPEILSSYMEKLSRE
jgi:hypothetical protein